jgi:hypothetical protein
MHKKQTNLTKKQIKKQLNAIEAYTVSFKRYDGQYDGKYVEEEEIRYPFIPCSMTRYDGSLDGIEFENELPPVEVEIVELTPELLEEAVRGLYFYRPA